MKQLYCVKALLIGACVVLLSTAGRAQLPARLSILTKGLWKPLSRCVGDTCGAILDSGASVTESYRFAADSFTCPWLGSHVGLRMDHYALERDPLTDELQQRKSSCPDYLGFLSTNSDSVWHLVVCGEHWPYIARLSMTGASSIVIEAISPEGKLEAIRYVLIDSETIPINRSLEHR